MKDCIFCKIIKGEIPSAKVYEDEFVISFLDIAPNNKGHCLVVPKKHSNDFLEMDEKSIDSVFCAAKKIANAIKNSLKCDFNIVMNNGKSAGQVVFHSHVHVVPRFEGDGFEYQKSKKEYKGSEIKEFAEKIKAHING